MVIGVISDTHGLLRPQAIAALHGSERILHAGDIDSPEVLAELAKIAPVTAIRGNVDPKQWPSILRQTEMVELGGVSISMIHDLSRLDLRPEAAGIRVVVYGHSHQPRNEEKNGVLYFNPGSAGPKRFNLPVSVGRLLIDEGQVRGELIDLGV
jgi:putative phosphoesterase